MTEEAPGESPRTARIRHAAQEPGQQHEPQQQQQLMPSPPRSARHVSLSPSSAGGAAGQPPPPAAAAQRGQCAGGSSTPPRPGAASPPPLSPQQQQQPDQQHELAALRGRCRSLEQRERAQSGLIAGMQGEISRLQGACNELTMGCVMRGVRPEELVRQTGCLKKSDAMRIKMELIRWLDDQVPPAQDRDLLRPDMPGRSSPDMRLTPNAAHSRGSLTPLRASPQVGLAKAARRQQQLPGAKVLRLPAIGL